MNLHYTISANTLFCLLLVGVVGCDQLESLVFQKATVAPEAPVTTETPVSPEASFATEVSTPDANPFDLHYKQLLSKRLDIEEKIREAMDLYRSTKREVGAQEALLQQYLGNKPCEETIDLFVNIRGESIPSDLRVAYSCWRTLVPDETLLLRISAWLDKQQFSEILEEFDIKIKEIEHRRQLGRFLDRSELEEIDRLLARPIAGWDSVNDSDMALLEQEAIEKLKNRASNWK